jgi:hypothetical protein
MTDEHDGYKRTVRALRRAAQGEGPHVQRRRGWLEQKINETAAEAKQAQRRIAELEAEVGRMSQRHTLHVEKNTDGVVKVFVDERLVLCGIDSIRFSERLEKAVTERDEARQIAHDLRARLSQYLLPGTPVEPFPWESDDE